MREKATYRELDSREEMREPIHDTSLKRISFVLDHSVAINLCPRNFKKVFIGIRNEIKMHQIAETIICTTMS